MYGKCKQLVGQILKQQSTPHPLASHLRNLLPPKEITDQLVQTYLRTFESVLRVLHVPYFLGECQRFWHSPDDASPEFILQLLMVAAIGAGFSPKLVGDYNPSTWIHAAEVGLRSIDSEKRASVTGVQILCLVLLARQINPDSTEKNLPWITAEGLLRAAMHIGLHITPSRLPPMSFYEEQIRIRLWATVIEIYLQHCLEVGGSPSILAHELDLELPCNIADEHFDEHTTAPPTPEPMDQFTHTSIQITLVQCFAVRLEIAAFVNDPRREGPYKEILQLASRLSSFCKSNHQRFQRDARPQAHRFSMRLMDFFMHRFLLALHAPFAFRALADPTLCFSRKVGLQVALTLLDRSLCTDDDEYARALLVGVGFFAGSTIQAASIVCAELISQMEEEISVFTLSPGSAGRQILCKVLDDYINLLRRRVIQAEPDIQIFMLFSGLAAQIEALHSGRSVEKAIEHAMQQGLMECQKILEDRAQPSLMAEPSLELTDHFTLDEISWSANELQDWMSCGGLEASLLMPTFQ